MYQEFLSGILAITHYKYTSHLAGDSFRNFASCGTGPQALQVHQPCGWRLLQVLEVCCAMVAVRTVVRSRVFFRAFLSSRTTSTPATWLETFSGTLQVVALDLKLYKYTSHVAGDSFRTWRYVAQWLQSILLHQAGYSFGRSCRHALQVHQPPGWRLFTVTFSGTVAFTL